MFCSLGLAGEPPQTVDFNLKEMITQLDVFFHQNWRVKRLKQLGCKRETNNHGAQCFVHHNWRVSHLKQFDVRRKKITMQLNI